MKTIKYILLLFVMLCTLLTSCNYTPANPNNPHQDKKKVLVSLEADEEINKNYYVGDKVVLPTLEKEDHTFDGWMLNDVLYKDEYIISEEDEDVLIFVATFTEIDYLTPIIDKVNLPNSTSENLTLPNEIDGCMITWQSYSSDIIDDNGVIKQSDVDCNGVLNATFNYHGKTKSKLYTIVVKSLDASTLFKLATDNLTELKYENASFVLPNSFKLITKSINGTWTSNNPSIVAHNGKVLNFPQEDTTVNLTLTLTINDETFTKVFNVVVKGVSGIDRIDQALANIKIPTYLTDNYVLPTCFDYDVTGTWTSEDHSVITNDGIVKIVDNVKSVKMKLKLELILNDKLYTKEREYTMMIDKKEALKVVYASTFDENSMSNCQLVGGKLELKHGETLGTYESNEISTIEFTSLVPTWSAISSTVSTVEFLIRVSVNGVWSSYISYCPGGWGLGLQNKAVDVNGGVARLSTDEIMCTGNGDKIQFKLILRRKSANDPSPKVSLVSFALKGSTYNGASYDLSSLPKEHKYDVPKLCQLVVPTIGNSICSATSTTMLLKYKGMDFKAYDSAYEHRYIASIVRDYGNGIYGNWVYNCVTMGAYGFNAYVERMYSINELVTHLALVGPVALSVKGKMVSDKKTYTTSGHLIVAIGYKIVDGNISIICNDPNVNEVECTYSYDVMNTTWRNIAYVIE